MEEWKNAFKLIHNKTPTKADLQCASKAVRGPEEENDRKLRRSPRKATLNLKRALDSAAFGSPVKRRRVLDTISKPSTSTTYSPAPEEKENNPRTISFPSELVGPSLESPMKSWSPLKRRMAATPKKTPEKSRSVALDFKTPSPKKSISNRLVCRNISALLDIKTPVKADQPSELDEEEPQTFADEKPEGAKKPRDPSAAPRRKAPAGNYVSLNLRKKKFVKGKSSKFSKKKWLKNKRFHK